MAAITRSPEDSVPILAARKHHWLVRITHWLNIPILLALILSGLSIYWASPVYQHAPDAQGNTDYFRPWFYDHFSLGTAMLASALRWHWLFGYLFLLNGVLYVAGLVLGGGIHSLIPRRTDFVGALQMQRYYVGLPLATLRRRPWPHPKTTGKYNSLQRLAYASMPVCGLLAVLSGWAIHKPMQLWWLAAAFGGYHGARLWHFWLMWVFIAFVIPHVVLVAADGWDTFRSMVVGWTVKVPSPEAGEGASDNRGNNTTSTPRG